MRIEHLQDEELPWRVVWDNGELRQGFATAGEAKRYLRDNRVKQTKTFEERGPVARFFGTIALWLFGIVVVSIIALLLFAYFRGEQSFNDKCRQSGGTVVEHADEGNTCEYPP